MKITFDYSKLKGRIIEKFGSQKDFADALNVACSEITRHLNSIGFKSTTIIEWCKALEIAQDEIGLYFFTLKVDT